MDQAAIALSMLAAANVAAIWVNILNRGRRKSLSKAERNAEDDEWEDHERNAW
jgi:hypothetical protein